ncbi:hypothetical protein HQ393_02900 [Chitinibacter bivalviorum]|uniref:Uncharacterized protein n=1 Tax=Chitinibacter bivalviorum TaxID=2739434 RepID=A0A7H9BFT3_9NEIS|nr:hypothetical protein [Chitinibacter bivalviorum]QLG87282.1 hypothetical protein HQ393_02900 [Chitinibacter bivalviorum]
MKQLLKLAVLSASVLMAGSAMAEETASAAAKADVTIAKGTDITIAKGKVGQAPVQVVYDYLVDRISDENGLADYQTLQINQKSPKAEDYQNVTLEVIKSGLADDSVATQRYRFVMNFTDDTHVWQIKSVKQEWQCRRGNSKAWTQKPCK